MLPCNNRLVDIHTGHWLKLLFCNDDELQEKPEVTVHVRQCTSHNALSDGRRKITAFTHITPETLTDIIEELASSYELRSVCAGVILRDKSSIFIGYMCHILSSKN
jgi:hypothetical protein